MVNERAGQSEPRFMVWRNGHLIDFCDGVKIPVIQRAVKENAPMGPGADKQEDNGLIAERKEMEEAKKGGGNKGGGRRGRK